MCDASAGNGVWSGAEIFLGAQDSGDALKKIELPELLSVLESFTHPIDRHVLVHAAPTEDRIPRQDSPDTSILQYSPDTSILQSPASGPELQ
jgi:hypothetical protein